MPDNEKKQKDTVKAPKTKTYRGELLTPGTVPLSESDKVAAELAKTKTQKSVWKDIPKDANAEGINKFQDYLKSKGIAGIKDLQSDEGYKKILQPELEKFNSENPNLAITPQHIEILQNYHKAVDPRIVIDKRYGPETTQLRYPNPTVSTTETTGSSVFGRRQEFGGQNDVINVIAPKLGQEGYTGAETVQIEKSTGKVLDKAKNKFPGQYYNGVLQKEFEQGYADGEVNMMANKPSNITNTIKTGPANADISVVKPGVSVYENNLLSGGGGGGGTTPIDKPIITNRVLPSIAPIVEQYGQKKAKGGLVNKVKGYIKGGEVASLVAKPVGDISSSLIDRGTQDEYGRQTNYAAGIGSGALGGLGKGVAAGSALGVPGMLLGGGLGLVGGALSGGFKTQSDKAAIQAEKDAKEAAKNAEIVARQRMEISEKINKANQERASYLPTMGSLEKPALKKGGLVSKVKKMANGGEMYSQQDNNFGYDNQDFINQSTGGHQSTIGGGDGIFKSSPMFNKGGLVNKVKCMKDGGYLNLNPVGTFGTPGEAYVMPESEREQGYQRGPSTEDTKHGFSFGGGGGLSFSPMFKKGGYVKGPGTGTSDEVNAKVRAGSFITPAKNAPVAAKIATMVDGGKVKAPTTKKADLKEENGEKVKLSNGEFVFTPEQKNKIITDLGEDVLEALAPEAESNEDEMAKGGPVKKKDKSKNENGLKVSEMKKLAPMIPTEEQSKKQSENSGKNWKLPNPQPLSSDPSTNPNITSESVTLDTVTKKPEAGGSYSPKRSFNMNDEKLGALVDLGTGLANTISGNAASRRQVNTANKFLAEAGKRPVGTIDAGFQGVLNNSMAAAKYGLSPQENALLNQQNTDLRNQEIAAQRGAGMQNIVNTRSAINDSFGRGLKTAIANTQAQQAKQAQANALTVNKAEMQRQLFEDTMGAWQQNQKAGATLLSTGLADQIASKRYQAALLAQEKNRLLENPQYNYSV